MRRAEEDSSVKVWGECKGGGGEREEEEEEEEEARGDQAHNLPTSPKKKPARVRGWTVAPVGGGGGTQSKSKSEPKP